MFRSAVMFAAVLSVGLLQAQDQPTFRTGANYVRVDMYATIDGAPVTDLRPEEIQILEDGVPQAIEAFEYVRIRPGSVQVAPAQPNTVEESRQMAADPRARVFVIFLDSYHTRVQNLGLLRDSLEAFVEQLAGPDDLIALMRPEMAASEITLERKTAWMARFLRDSFWARRGGVLPDPEEVRWQLCYGIQEQFPEIRELIERRREKVALDALEDLIAHLDGIREERKAVITITEGWQLFEPRTVLAGTKRSEGLDVAMCEVERMALMRMDHTNRLREITERANRSNVTFYAIGSDGLAVFDGHINEIPLEGVPSTPIGEPSFQQEDNSRLQRKHSNLRYLAEETDGVSVVNTNNIRPALERIVDDLSSYYLLGYYSTNTALNGRFRNIDVRVTRPGVDVRHRRGYRGRTAEELVNAVTDVSPEADALTKAFDSVAGAAARSGFRIRASSWAPPPASGEPEGRFWVVGELDFRTRREPAWTEGAQADVVVVAADGTTVMSREIDVPAGGAPFVVSVPEAGQLPVGEYAVRVRVRTARDEALALSDTARVEMDAPSALGDAVFWRSGPSTGRQYQRTADPQFMRNERLRLEIPTTAAADASARLLDRNGNPLAVPAATSLRPDPDAGLTWVVVDLTLAPLAPADYAVEVVQGDERQLTGFRLVR